MHLEGPKQTFVLLPECNRIIQVSFITSSETIYKQYRHERMVGHYAFDTPNLLVNDLELAKAIMIKDFDHFVDRRSVTLNTDNPINKVTLNMMTFLKGDKWKFARSTLSPLFTSGKLKSMTGFINKVSTQIVNTLRSIQHFCIHQWQELMECMYEM